MDKASEAAALAGIAGNIGFSDRDRLAAADKALDFYVVHTDKLIELLEYLESKNPRDGDGASELGYYEAYGDAASRLRAILDGE